MEASVIRTRGLHKAFGDNVALNDMDLDIPKGKMFGLLGPNGAGKTTLIRIITQILQPDRGEVMFNGCPLQPADIYRIGYMPEERGLYKKMKVGEQLLYLGRLRNLSATEAKKRIHYWMDRLDIGDWWGKKVEELSKGMQQKIQFVSTVLHEPEVLILDEPFSGLDPVNTNLIRREIAELHRKGTTIIFSTHRMEQVEEICEHIVLIHKGNALLNGPLKEIRDQFKENHFRIEFEGEVPDDLTVSEYELLAREEGVLHFRLHDGQNANGLIRELIGQGVEIHGVAEVLPTLNDIFIQQVGEPVTAVEASAS